MTADEFRKLAMSMADAIEVGHMGHPDFRIGGKIFATLGYPDDEWGMLKLTPEEQTVLIAAQPAMFAPAKGAWGRSGSTLVRLSVAREAVVRRAIELACSIAAQKARPASSSRNLQTSKLR